MSNDGGCYDSAPATIKHIKRVHELLGQFLGRLRKRVGTVGLATAHDASKLKEPEKPVFDRVTPLLRALTYGTPQYRAVLDEMGEALAHHYAANRHHPEHFKNGMQGMTLVDLVEMFCDWCAATERHEDGSILRSIRQNMKRFGFGETLACVFENTAREYGMGKGVAED